MLVMSTSETCDSVPATVVPAGPTPPDADAVMFDATTLAAIELPLTLAVMRLLTIVAII
jgi:hypothetical protein